MGRRIPGDDNDGAATDDQLTLIWDEAKKHLRGSLNESAFQFWFDRTLPLGLDDGAFVIGVPNDFAREWIEKRFAGQVAEALGQVLGDAVEVRVVVDERDNCSAHLLELERLGLLLVHVRQIHAQVALRSGKQQRRGPLQQLDHSACLRGGCGRRDERNAHERGQAKKC